MRMRNAPGLDREEPELGYEEDIPTPTHEDGTREAPQVDDEAAS